MAEKQPNKPFEPIDDVEIVELAELLKRIHKRNINDAGTMFMAQLIGMQRLVTSQHVANQQVMKAQEEGHLEMIEEQRTLVRWQKFATIATGLMVIITGVYAYETHKIVDANLRMATAAQAQLDLAKEQVRETGRPRLFVSLRSMSETIPRELFTRQSVIFELQNKSAAPAYNTKCAVTLMANKRVLWKSTPPCRDMLLTNYMDGVEFSLPELALDEANKSKEKSIGIQISVFYEDAPKNGKKYTATRFGQLVAIPEGLELKSLALEAN